MSYVPSYQYHEQDSNEYEEDEDGGMTSAHEAHHEQDGLSSMPRSGRDRTISEGEHSDSATGGDGHHELKEPLREQDRFLPIANVSRIMKLAVPGTGKIAKDSKECVQECVSEFISFLTSEAAERCSAEKRKTINGEDILFAMSTLGFDNYVEPLKVYLNLYRDFTMKEQKLLPEDQLGSSSGQTFDES